MLNALPKRSAPTVVEGVIQYRIPVDPADYSLLRPQILATMSLPPSELISQWLSFCRAALWQLPQVQLMPRLRTLYQEGIKYEVMTLDIPHFLETAHRFSVITSSEKRSLEEIWQVRSTRRFPEELDHYALKQRFWAVQYLDYHLYFIEMALERGKLLKGQADALIDALLALPTSGLTLEIIRDTFDKALGDPRGYARIQKELESLYVNLGGEFVNVYDQDSIADSLDGLVAKGKVLSPGFDVVPLDAVRLIDATKLSISNVPEISIEALRSVVSYGGELGQGNVIKTHSLFPGEKAILTIESFSKEASSYVLTSSVLDSTSSEAESSLAREVGSTNSWNEESSRTSSFSVGFEAKASWGVGSAGASANFSGSSSDLSKSALSTLQKAVNNQANKVSNNRSVRIDTTSTRNSESSLRQSVVRTIENINVSRPLNFVFRQLTQEILTLFTTKDIRVVIRPGLTDNGKASQLQEVPDYLKSYMFIESVPITIVEKYYSLIVDCARNLGGEDKLPEKTEFLVLYPTDDPQVPRFSVNKLRDRRLPPDELLEQGKMFASLSKEFGNEDGVSFDGYLNDIMRYVIKTEGVYVDCFLSETEGLDEYSRELQIQAIEERKHENARASAIVDALSLAKKLVNGASTPEEQLSAYERVVIPLISAMKDADDE